MSKKTQQGRWTLFGSALVLTIALGMANGLTGCKAGNAPTAVYVPPTATPTATSVCGDVTCTPTPTSTPGAGTTTLAAGDVAIVGFAARHNDSNGINDQFAAVFLKAVNAGTSIIFTTSNWSGTALATNEAQIYWHADRDYPAGSVFELFNGDTDPLPITIFANGTAYGQAGNFTIDNGTLAGGFGLAKGGDNLFVVQGTLANPTFLAGMIFKINWGDTDGNGTCAKPPSLTDGVSSINVGGYSAGYYNCGTLSGTSAQLAAAINTPADWAGKVDNSNTDLNQSGNVLSCSLAVHP